MSVNASIVDVGLPASIIRTAGDISTSIYIKPKAKSGASYDFNAWMTTDSGAVVGDLVNVTFELKTISYLVITLVEDERAGEFFKYNVKLMRCNRTVTVKKWVAGSNDFTDSVTDVPCLITGDRAVTVDSDRAVVIPGFAAKDNTYYMYIQPNDIGKEDKLVDDKGISLSISGGVNPYFADGSLHEIQVKIEG